MGMVYVQPTPNIMTPEHKLMNEIRRWCGEHDLLCFRTNVGSVMTAEGRIFNAGLPVGFPDLMIANYGGKMMFCECKVPPNKPTPQQWHVLDELNRRGFSAFPAYSLQDFIKKYESAVANKLF